MKNLSSLFKWFGGIIATIITGVAIWWLTQGIKKPDPPKPDTTVVVQPTSEINKPAMAISINPTENAIRWGEQTQIQVHAYDQNNDNKPIGNVKINVQISDGIIIQAGNYPQTNYTSTTDQNGNITLTFLAPVKPSGGPDYRALAVKQVTFVAVGNFSIDSYTYNASQNIQILIH